MLFALLAVLWFLAACGDQPEYRRPSHLFVTGTALCAAVLVVSAVLPAGPRVLTWGLTGIAYLAAFTAVIATATPVQAAALTMTDALIERFGLLIIIVLGETVTGVVDGLTARSLSLLDHRVAGVVIDVAALVTFRRPVGSELLDWRHPVHELTHPLADGEDDGHHGLLVGRPFDRPDVDGVVTGVTVERLDDLTGFGVTAP